MAPDTLSRWIGHRCHTPLLLGFGLHRGLHQIAHVSPCFTKPPHVCGPWCALLGSCHFYSLRRAPDCISPADALPGSLLVGGRPSCTIRVLRDPWHYSWPLHWLVIVRDG